MNSVISNFLSNHTNSQKSTYKYKISFKMALSCVKSLKLIGKCAKFDFNQIVGDGFKIVDWVSSPCIETICTVNMKIQFIFKFCKFSEK